MKPLRIGAYIRVSTDNQVNVHEGSLDSQKYRIKEFLQYKNRQQPNWGEIVEFYVEEGASAGTTNRPAYLRLMNDIRSGKVNLILVSDLTRLSRNLTDFCNLIDELEKYKASYFSMKEQFDTSTPIGRMMVYIIIALGQFERETTSERVATNCHVRAVKGLLNGGIAPLGYDKHPEKRGLLVINEQEANLVKIIFQTFLDEGSRSKSIEKLHQMGIYPKRTAKQKKEIKYSFWTVQSLKNILQNTAYIGIREVNKYNKEEDQSYLKHWQKYSTVDAAWPAIIDVSMFNEVQCQLKEACEKERSRRENSEQRVFLLSGLLTCGETGLPLVGQVGHSSNGTVHRYYHYVRKPKNLHEIRPRLKADDLEEKIIGELKRALATSNYFQDIEKTLTSHIKETFKSNRMERDRVQFELAELENRIKAIWTNQSKMQLNDEALKLTSDELNNLAKQKQDCLSYLNDLNQNLDKENAIKEQVLFIENQIRLCLQGWNKATPAMRKRLLRRTIKDIVVTRDEIQLTFWTGTTEDGFSRLIANAGDPNSLKNIVAFKKTSSKGLDRNLMVDSSGDVRVGSEGRT